MTAENMNGVVVEKRHGGTCFSSPITIFATDGEQYLYHKKTNGKQNCQIAKTRFV